jgi:hypothetical protein
MSGRISILSDLLNSSNAIKIVSTSKWFTIPDEHCIDLQLYYEEIVDHTTRDPSLVTIANHCNVQYSPTLLHEKYMSGTVAEFLINWQKFSTLFVQFIKSNSNCNCLHQRSPISMIWQLDAKIESVRIVRKNCCGLIRILTICCEVLSVSKMLQCFVLSVN